MTTASLPPWDSEERNAKRARWQPRNARVIHSSPWIEVELSEPIAPTGRVAQYGMVRFRNRAMGMIPLHEDGTVTLVGQMRYTFDAWSWEIPEGGVPHDEDAMAGARRELREETGFEAASLVEILRLDLSNSVSDEVGIIYLATGLTQGETQWDDTENLEIARVPFKDVLEAVIKGQIRDSLTVAAVLRVYHMAVTGALEASLAAKIV
jgi:8-oxo-dGTP pyrophosphatase MutT (NUDIX family)